MASRGRGRVVAVWRPRNASATAAAEQRIRSQNPEFSGEVRSTRPMASRGRGRVVAVWRPRNASATAAAEQRIHSQNPQFSGEVRSTRSMASRGRGRVVAVWRPRNASATASAAAAAAANDQSRWANLLPELIREVVVRLEEDESVWPKRKHVVACAGVCRSWRRVMEEVVRTPEVCGRLTFPISLKQPGPRNFPLKCFIRRDPITETFYLYLALTQALTENGKFLLAARKYETPTCTDYVVSLDVDGLLKGSDNYIGKLSLNLSGTKFTVYDARPPYGGGMVSKCWSPCLLSSKQASRRIPAEGFAVAHISYELHAPGSRGPRKIQCTMNSIPALALEPGGVAPTPTKSHLSSLGSAPSISSIKSKSSSPEIKSRPLLSQEEVLVLKNKTPMWIEQIRCWCLDFGGRVTIPSVKNFQLVPSDSAGQEQECVLLQFGKVGSNLFTLDYRYPLSAFQAFAISLSSFDAKTTRENNPRSLAFS